MHAIIGKTILIISLIAIAFAMLWLIVMGVGSYVRARRLGRRGHNASLILPLLLAAWIAYCINDIMNH